MDDIPSSTAASTLTPPPRPSGLQPNSEGPGYGAGTDDTFAAADDEEEVHPKVTRVKMTPRGGRHAPYERDEDGDNNNNADVTTMNNDGNNNDMNNDDDDNDIKTAAKLSTKRLYIGNLSYSTTWRQLKDHLSQNGQYSIVRADILQMADGRSKGCGIVEFSSIEEARECCAVMNDSELGGRQIFVREDRESGMNTAGSNTGGGGGGGGGSGKRVYVGNLAYEVAWQELKDHMREVGDVAYAEVMMMNDGRSKGCGIVEFVTEEGAREAIDKLNDSELMGRQIFVREDRESRGMGVGGFQRGGNHGGGGGGRGGHHQQHQHQWGNVSVYVGNLAYETTWQDLKDHMRRVGNIDKADILQGNDGRSKGCGIVIYQNPKEAQRAIRELQNSELNGRPIFVREDRESNTSGGGFGNSYNRGGGYNNNNNNNFGSSYRTSSNLMPGTPSEQGCQLFIGNLSWGTGWRDLKDHFAQCGAVDRAEVAEGPDGRKRGFGLIRFRSAVDAQNAIDRLNGVEFMGRALEVRLDNKV